METSGVAIVCGGKSGGVDIRGSEVNVFEICGKGKRWITFLDVRGCGFDLAKVF